MLKYLPKDALAQWALGAVVVTGAASVAYVLVFSQDDDAPAPELRLTEPPSVSAPTTEAAPDMQIAMAAPRDALAPRFDLVRVTDLGDVLIAGQAPAMSAVAVLIDEAQVAQTVSSAAGEFVLIFEIDQSPVPRVLELEVRLASGARVRSVDTLMLTPRSDALSEAPDAPRSMGRPVAVEPLFPDAPAPQPATEPGPLPTRAPLAMLVRADGSVQALGEAARLPQDGGQVSIDALSYDADGAVSVTGRAAQGATDIQIYIDNQPILRARAGQDGAWQAQLEGIDRGVYQLRVDEIDADARVTSRAEIPFERVTPEIAREATGPQALVVQPGNTLWGISEDRFGDGRRYMRIFDANRDQIRNPDLIYPGQVFTLPEAAE